MTLGKIAPQHRAELRWHGWLMAAWVFAVGWLASWLLLRVFHVASPLWRWPLAMLAMYGLGFVGGCYLYVRWRRRRAEAGEKPAHASAPDEIAYEQAAAERRRRMQWLSDMGDLSPLAELFPPLAFVLIPLLAVALLAMLGLTPVAFTEMFGGFLAELVLEFVIGASLMRRILRPRPLDEYATSMVGKTWWFALLAVCIAAGLGYAVHRVAPEAVTLGQAIRGT